MTYGSLPINNYIMLSIQSPCRLLGQMQPEAVGSFILYLIDMKSTTDDQRAKEK